MTFNWQAAGEYLDATQEQHDREQRMGNAQDKLADYEAMRDATLDFLWSLRRGLLPDNLFTTTVCMLDDLSSSMRFGLHLFDVESVVDPVVSDNRPAAEQAIDEHFASDIARLRAVAEGRE